ncbi:MAG TPA: SRPBCC family protein [Elusimicrobiota bacterium]|nr:SRPBCC family protein [Elusimicrobiota bacterium]
MTRVSQRLMISAPRESVRLYLRDLDNLTKYSRRIFQVQLKSRDEHKVSFEASGRFLGLPWKATLEAEFPTDGGLRLTLSRGGPLWLAGASYHLRSVSGGTILSNDEEYRLPFLLRPLSPLLKKIASETMDLELRVIKEGAEQLNRKIRLREIESAL